MPAVGKVTFCHIPCSTTGAVSRLFKGDWAYVLLCHRPCCLVTVFSPVNTSIWCSEAFYQHLWTPRMSLCPIQLALSGRQVYWIRKSSMTIAIPFLCSQIVSLQGVALNLMDVVGPGISALPSVPYCRYASISVSHLQTGIPGRDWSQAHSDFMIQ